MPPSDASIIPFQRLRASFCIGSIAEPITAYDHHSTPGTTTAATDVDEIEPVVTSVTSSSLLADVSKSSTGRSNHLPDVIVVAAPNVASSHKRGVSRHTHRWSCYLRPVDDGAESLLFYSLIQSVTFKLDRSFNEPIRVIDAPPFAVSDVAWAEHHVEILVTFVEESGLGSFVSSSSSSGAGAAGNTSSSSGSGPTGSSTSGVTGASHHAHSQLLLHHTVFLRERVAPEFCHVGLTAARMIANGEPAKCLVVPDSLTQGSGGGGGGVGVGGSTSTAPSSHSEDQANGSVNRDQEENNHFSNVSIAARALREQLFTSHEGQTAAASSFDDKRRVSSALAMCMFSGGNAAAGGRVAVSERFDSLLVTHPRRKTVLFFQQLMRECKELEDEALAAASTSASTSSPSVDRKRQQKLLPLSERIVLEDEHDVNRSDGSDAEDDGNRRRRKGPPERGKPKQLPMAPPPLSQHKTIVLRAARLGYERLRQIEQDLVLASAHFVARSAAATIRYDSNGGGTAPLHTYDVDAHMITDDDRSIASSPIMGLLLLRVQHQVRLGFSLRYAAQERSATILSMTLETLEDERLASLEELRNIDTQIARLRGKAVHMLSRYRLRLKRMRDGGVDGSDAEATTAMQKEREDDDAKLFARVVAAQRKPPQTTGAVATSDSQFVVVVDDESM